MWVADVKRPLGFFEQISNHFSSWFSDDLFNYQLCEMIEEQKSFNRNKKSDFQSSEVDAIGERNSFDDDWKVPSQW